MRKAFRAEREFLTLSELEEYDARRDAAGEQPKRWSEKLASFSKRSDDDVETARSEREGFLNFGRLLGRDDESIPPDPFVMADEDREDNEADDDRMVVSVGSSKELPASEAEPLVGDDWVSEMAASAAAEDSRSSNEHPAAGVSFADIMAEFADDAEEDEDLDSLADKLMAEHASRSTSLDDVVADFSGDSIDASDVDQFELSPEMFLDDATESPEDVPVLSMTGDTDNSFDTGEDVLSFDDSVPTLPEQIAEPSAFDFDEPAVEVAGANAPRTQMARATESITGRKSVSEIFGNDGLEGGSLWKDSSHTTGWDSKPARRSMNSQQQFSSHQQVKTSWDSAAIPGSSTAFDRPVRQQRSEDSMSFASSPLVLPDSRLTSDPHGQAATLSQVPMNPPSQSDLSSDPFLNDFETVAETAPETAPATAATGDGVVAGFSPRMWVVLLGSVIILCLLLAPERQNTSELSNR